MSCKYAGAEYDEGSLICANGRELKCSGGEWKETGYSCMSTNEIDTEYFIASPLDRKFTIPVDVWVGQIAGMYGGPGEPIPSGKCGLNANGNFYSIVNEGEWPLTYFVSELWTTNGYTGWRSVTVAPNSQYGLGCDVPDSGFGGEKYRSFSQITCPKKGWSIPLPKSGMNVEASDVLLIIQDRKNGNSLFNRDMFRQVTVDVQSPGLNGFNNIPPFLFIPLGDRPDLSGIDVRSAIW